MSKLLISMVSCLVLLVSTQNNIQLDNKSCISNEKVESSSFYNESTEDSIFAVITDTESKDFNSLDRTKEYIELDSDTDERIRIVMLNDNMKISIQKIYYNLETQSFDIIENMKTFSGNRGDVFEIRANLVEGIPSYRLYTQYNGKQAKWYIQYNGRDGVGTEYINGIEWIY